jgi:hypothetical protein
MILRLCQQLVQLTNELLSLSFVTRTEPLSNAQAGFPSRFVGADRMSENDRPSGAALTKQADYLTDALLKAGARYDRYAAEKNRNKWLDYTARWKRLEKITRSIQALATDISELDILTRDDLWSRVDPIAVEALIGSLLIVGKATNDLAKETQKNGRPRDLAEERWILELADIYENAFSEHARVWRTDDGLMSDFYALLELSRPEAFPRHGKLSRRQIDRTLSQRRWHNFLLG